MMKSVAMVAHDRMKTELSEWVVKNRVQFKDLQIVATGTTGKLLSEHAPELNITSLKSGPLGGDQQIGAMIAEGQLQALFFFQDPMTPQPHDSDIKALARLAQVYDIPMAGNPSTANYMITSPYFDNPELAPGADSVNEQFQDYLEREID